ncbi:MAG TPA: MtrB/PioB family outer membrane beta-barrel protein [Thermoanaerobaculia bacterium]|nr:MtrB/PioB family outer membrane beta-barrel protein [Thermoanaerobaculia bacterium]
MWIRILLITILSAPFSLLAQQPEQPATPEATESDNGTIAEVMTGGTLGADEGSSKFNEYRDLDNGLRLFGLRYRGYTPDSGRFIEAVGTNLGLDDQSFKARAGRYGTWSAALEIDSLPHRLTNDAFSPYTDAGDGLFTVPGVVGILTTTADNVNFRASDMLENDSRIAAYLNQNLHALPQIGTDNNRMSLQLTYSPVAAIDARLTASRRTREGEKITYGPLGDRPPRTMNVELPEPIDHSETTLQFDLGYANRFFDLNLEIFAPEFSNDIDSMRWQSIYFGPDADGAADYNNDIILAGNAIVRRAVSTFGQRALPPDNRFTNTTLTFGANTALNGRFTATAAMGRLRQDETLLPYSYSTLTKDWNSTGKLPRLSAEAAIDTFLLDLQYTFAPLRGLRVRPFFRSYNLDNDTPEDQWWYVTQDAASNTTGSATFMNKRINRAYDSDRRNLGVEGTWQKKSLTLGLTIEQEAIDRGHREADTEETIIRARASYRPLQWLSLRGRAAFGQRDADGYDFRSELSSYWYTSAENGTGTNNPAFSFTNHPDMRRFDVSDRERSELDLTASATASPTLSFSATWSRRENDFDSDVTPVQPLAGTSFGAANETTLGIQLGLLSQDTSRFSFDANWNPNDRWGATAFVSLESIDLDQRGTEFSEDLRTTAQTPRIGTPGQSWVDPANLWRAGNEDETTTFGVGLNYSIIPDRLTLTADYSRSNGTVDIGYSGFGSDQPLDTIYYAFRSPETVEHVQRIANLAIEYRLPRGFVLGLRYLFDDYDVKDWMQEPQGEWVDVVSNNFVRDSTRDNRWGNRLPRLVGYLGPSYSANVGFLTLGYSW